MHEAYNAALRQLRIKPVGLSITEDSESYSESESNQNRQSNRQFSESRLKTSPLRIQKEPSGKGAQMSDYDLYMLASKRITALEHLLADKD